MDDLGVELQTCPCGKEFRDAQCVRSKCPACRRPKVPCPRCERPMSPKASTCRACRQRPGPTHPSYRGGTTRHQKGYVMEHDPARGRYVMQHILVMEDHLGRQLLPGETVHHKYGVRDDNRIENLELWVKPQPTGIRAEDAVEWALEILRRYAPESLEGAATDSTGR